MLVGKNMERKQKILPGNSPKITRDALCSISLGMIQILKYPSKRSCIYPFLRPLIFGVWLTDINVTGNPDILVVSSYGAPTVSNLKLLGTLGKSPC